MSLRIQNNIAAMNTHRQLTISSNAMGKSLERLSSGFRINKAADDAAGLAISQQFRADIASYKVASRNTAEASSLLQVAEGALDQMGNILTRLKELATQAASDNAGSNRDKINAEANELVLEFDRIATSTEYAETQLLTGDIGGSTLAGAAGGSHSGSAATTVGQNGYMFGVTGSLAGISIGTGATATLDSSIASLADGANNTWEISAAGAQTVSLTNGQMTFEGVLADGTSITIAGMGEDQGDLVIETTAANTGAADGTTIRFNNLGLDEDTISFSGAQTGTYTFSTVSGNIVLSHSGGENQAVTPGTAGTEQTLNFDNLGVSLDLNDQWAAEDLDGLTITVTGTPGTDMTFQIGAMNQADNQLAINLDDAQASAMGLTADMLVDQSSAQTALDSIDTAIGALSDLRGNVGAYMNRLQYAASNLATTIENVQASESIIRDVDMASEMTGFVKNQILMQAGTAMLAQANMAPQQVLSLF